MKMKQLKPITLELGLSYTFNPADHLPDDWQGTREDAIEWLRSDIAENLHNWINPRDIYGSIREAKPDPTPELLSALKDCEAALNALRKNQRWDVHIKDLNDDVEEAVSAHDAARAAIAKAEGRGA